MMGYANADMEAVHIRFMVKELIFMVCLYMTASDPEAMDLK